MATGLITQDGIIIKREDGTEEIFNIPYNENNILIQEEDVILLLKKYGVNIDKVYHLKYFQEAMTHTSYIKKVFFTDEILIQAKNELGNPENLLELRPRSYERLEYLGDRVIKLIISLYLFHRFPQEDEGFMTRLQIELEDKTNLSKMCLEMGLNKFLIISKQQENIRGRDSERFSEDIFEAFFGALFSSNGFPPCVLLLLNLLETQIDYTEKLYRNKNFKDHLLRYYHSQKWGYPEYLDIEEYGPSHKKNFVVGVKKSEYKGIDTTNLNPLDVCLGFGIANKKRDAQQKASKMALILLKQLNDDQHTPEDIYYPDLEQIRKEKEEQLLEKENQDKENDEIEKNKEKEENKEKIIKQISENPLKNFMNYLIENE
jgi:dsRNA-specific ribonuclease